MHSAPLAPGDSGGPLFDTERRLVAVNIGVSSDPMLWFGSQGFWNYRGFANMPDHDWLRATMAADRARPAASTLLDHRKTVLPSSGETSSRSSVDCLPMVGNEGTTVTFDGVNRVFLGTPARARGQILP